MRGMVNHPQLREFQRDWDDEEDRQITCELIASELDAVIERVELGLSPECARCPTCLGLPTWGGGCACGESQFGGHA